MYVGNIPFDTNEKTLIDLFSQFGAVLHVHMPPATKKGRIQGFAFIKLPDKDAVQKALALDGQDLNGRPMKVSAAASTLHIGQNIGDAGRGGSDQGSQQSSGGMF